MTIEPKKMKRPNLHIYGRKLVSAQTEEKAAIHDDLLDSTKLHYKTLTLMNKALEASVGSLQSDGYRVAQYVVASESKKLIDAGCKE